MALLITAASSLAMLHDRGSCDADFNAVTAGAAA
jgi:hypothetical protein